MCERRGHNQRQQQRQCGQCSHLQRPSNPPQRGLELRRPKKHTSRCGPPLHRRQRRHRRQSVHRKRSGRNASQLWPQQRRVRRLPALWCWCAELCGWRSVSPDRHALRPGRAARCCEPRLLWFGRGLTLRCQEGARPKVVVVDTGAIIKGVVLHNLGVEGGHTKTATHARQAIGSSPWQRLCCARLPLHRASSPLGRPLQKCGTWRLGAGWRWGPSLDAVRPWLTVLEQDAACEAGDAGAFKRGRGSHRVVRHQGSAVGGGCCAALMTTARRETWPHCRAWTCS